MAKRSDQRPSFDICRINTDRLRSLSRGGLERVWSHLGKRRASRDKALVQTFVNALIWTKFPPNWGTKAQRGRKAGLAMRTEERIWNVQQVRRCAIRPEELVARDAVRQKAYDQETIDRLRGRRRPRIR